MTIYAGYVRHFTKCCLHSRNSTSETSEGQRHKVEGSGPWRCVAWNTAPHLSLDILVPQMELYQNDPEWMVYVYNYVIR